jgi:hypothetical protein
MPLATEIDQLLRAPRHRAAFEEIPRHASRLIFIAVVGGAIYGAFMGSFGGVLSGRALQMLYAAIKVPLLLSATFAIALPSFFVLNSVFGLRSDFATAVRALLAGQAGMAVILASLSPYVALWYASFGGYEAAILFNGVQLGIASVSAHLLTRAIYRPLAERRPAHRWMLRLWIVLYAFVGIQMAWVFRPFVGAPNVSVQFFRKEAWGNAYVVVAKLIGNALGMD